MSRSARVLALAAAPLPLVAALALAPTAATADPAVPLIALPGSTSPALAHSQRTGDLPADRRMSVSVALKLHDTAALDRLLAQVSDPRSAEYGHYLTPAQFTARFGPSQAEVAQVSAFLRDRGLRVDSVSGNRQVVTASGTTDQVQHAFGTSLGQYHDTVRNRDYFANDRAAALPASVASVVQGVVGLDDHSVRQHHDVRGNGRGHHAAPAGFGPTELRGAYDTGSLGDGSGQSVALWEFDGYQQANLTAYDQQYGLTAPASQTVSVDNANYDKNPGQGQGEVELDIEVIHALAPAANTFVYEAPNSDQGEIDMANQIASDKKVSVVSISWGSCEPDTTPASITSTDNALKQGAAEGISFFAASGDDGSKDCARSSTGTSVDAVDFPASSPNVTGVGGTTLTVSGSGYGSENAWNGSGGGTSTVFDKPSWQTGSASKRTVPDVSSDADPQSGYAIYTGGQWQTIGGTSAAAPMWAGFAALYDQSATAAGKPALGAANQALYQVGAASGSTAFHDVTAGSNGGFSAGPGYDQVTGWGSYDAAALTKALQGS